jgi:hypothetical protein
MRRGEIRVVDLEPVRGAESNKRRPAVIVSNDGANITAQRLARGVLTVVPVTSNTSRVHPFQVLLRAADTGLDTDSRRRPSKFDRWPSSESEGVWASFPRNARPSRRSAALHLALDRGRRVRVRSLAVRRYGSMFGRRPSSGLAGRERGDDDLV